MTALRRELRGLLADHLRLWAVSLQGWAWRLDPDEARTGPLVAAHEDAERILDALDAQLAARGAQCPCGLASVHGCHCGNADAIHAARQSGWPRP